MPLYVYLYDQCLLYSNQTIPVCSLFLVTKDVWPLEHRHTLCRVEVVAANILLLSVTWCGVTVQRKLLSLQNHRLCLYNLGICNT